MTLCKYKDLLGKPNEGVHNHVFGVAIVDLLLTIIVCIILWKWKGWNFWLVLGIALLSGIVLHRIFCVNTTLNKLIFGKV